MPSWKTNIAKLEGLSLATKLIIRTVLMGLTCWWQAMLQEGGETAPDGSGKRRKRVLEEYHKYLREKAVQDQMKTAEA